MKRSFSVRKLIFRENHEVARAPLSLACSHLQLNSLFVCLGPIDRRALWQQQRVARVLTPLAGQSRSGLLYVDLRSCAGQMTCRRSFRLPFRFARLVGGKRNVLCTPVTKLVVWAPQSCQSAHKERAH